MNIANLRIGTRLSVGFGVVVFLMAILVAVGLNRLAGIGTISEKIIQQDWVKADAAQIINARTRANAQATLQLFIVSDPSKMGAVFEQIDGNKAVIDGALGRLDALVDQPEGKRMLAEIHEARAAYVASFGKVAQLLVQGNRDQATALMNAETLPTLDRLQHHVTDLVKFQRRLVNERGAQAKQVIDSARYLMLGLGLTAVVMCIACAYLITRSITRPLHEAVRVAQTVASGDLTSRIIVKSRDETGQLLQSLRDMNESLTKMVSEVRLGTDTIATASSQLATGNHDLSSRTEEQASSLEETVAAMEELTSTVKENADNARQANLLAVSASEVAVKGGSVVLQVVDTMRSINESANKVVDIIGVIDGIAFQTNILALNAAVEAARAGEQGRGFAVVAAEVRTLAQRCATAAKGIKALIGDAVRKAEAGSELVVQAGATMDEIVASVQRVTDIMGEITAASEEQSTGIGQINQAMSQMDEVTQQNAALVEEAAAATESLQQQAGNLSQIVGVFKLDGSHTAAPAREALDVGLSTSRGMQLVASKAAHASTIATPVATISMAAKANKNSGEKWVKF